VTARFGWFRLGLVLGPLAATSATAAAQVPAVAIDEVHARPATGPLGDANGDGLRNSSQDEFVEILNVGADLVDVSGFVIATGMTPSARFTFPPGTVLPPGGRAVVFGGGVAGGDFGGAAVFSSGGLVLTDAPGAGYSAELWTAGSGGYVADTFIYDSSTFGSSCTTTCASQVRSPAGSGVFVSHASASGSAGILWSPGVAAPAAIPKVNEHASMPTARSTDQNVFPPMAVQFNMFMDPADFTNTLFKLYMGSCSAPLVEIPLTGVVAIDPARVQLAADTILDYATTYCASVDAAVRSASGTALAGPVRYEFTTRPASSRTAQTVVISEYGGASFSANNEFVELYNPTSSPVDVSGWFVQRRSAAGTRTCWASLPMGLPPIGPGRFFLVAGPGYVPADYAGAPPADHLTSGTTITGLSESVLLVASTGTCIGLASIVDAVSSGSITDTATGLLLPALATSPGNGRSIERKACFDSSADAGATGLFPGGGHAAAGNAEKLGASNADWILRLQPLPQSSIAGAETSSCAPGPPFDTIFRDGFE
jgi:hypothetical protein